jgi:hypothetical protein
MAIDMASVYAARYRKQPDMLRAAVMGQSPDASLDSYTALNALRLIKEADMMAMAGQAQQPTSAPSIVAQNLAPPSMQQGLGAMVPGAMGGQGMPPQGMPQQRAPMPQPTMQAASGGLAGMYTPEEDFAEGGIVAFQDKGYVDPDLTRGMAVTDDPLSRFLAENEGGTPSSTAIGRAGDTLNRYMNFDPKEMTPEEQEAFLDRYMARAKRAAGPDIYAPAKERQAAREAALAGDRKFGEGMAYLTAAGKILKGRNLAEGASEAAPAFAQQLGESRRAEQQEKRAIEQMNFALADAERKERMGDNRGAQAALAEARKFQQDANRAQGDKLRFAADIAARTVGYSKVNKGAGSGDAGTKLPQVDRETAAMQDKLIEMQAKNPEDPQIPILEKKIKARINIISTGKEGPTVGSRAADTIKSKENTAAQTALADFKSIRKSAWKKYVEASGGDEKAAEAAYKSGWMTKNPNAGSDDFDPNQAVDYIPTTAPAATSSAKPGAVLNYDANGKRIN